MILDGNSKVGSARVFKTSKELELQVKLDKAIEALKFVIINSGTSANYNLKARQTLKEIE